MNPFRSALVLALVPLVIPHFGCATNAPADAASSTQDVRFEIEVKLITGEADACERALGTSGSTACVVGAAEAARILDTAAHTCSVVSRPRILVGAGNQAIIQTMTKTEYVQDFDADARPVMGSIEHGARVLLTPKLGVDAKTDVALSVEVSGLRTPIRQHELTLPGSTQKLTVQLPELEAQKITTSFLVGDDDAVIVPVGATPGDDPVRAVVLRVHRRE